MANPNEGRRVVVVGDLIRDINVYGSVLGTSLETPTIVMKEEKRVEVQGGAGCVARNLQALKCLVRFISDKYMAVSKTRYWVGNHKLLQVDAFPTGVSPQSLADKIAMVDGAVESLDPHAVIISDYRHGMLETAYAQYIIDLCKRSNIPVLASSQLSHYGSNHDWYRHVDYLVVNEKEEGEIDRSEELFTCNIIITLGAKGTEAYYDDGYDAVVGEIVDVVDTCGAGDAFLAAYAAFLHEGRYEALRKANRWAAYSTTLPGTGVPKYAEVFGDL